MEKLLTTGQAAEICSVTPNTILNWIKSGRIKARRTPGGHFRVSRRELEKIERSHQHRTFRYCWEFNTENGGGEGCEECLVFKTRAMRCYEVARLAPEKGHQKLFCKTTCEECDYYRLMKGMAANVLVVSDRRELTESIRAQALASTFNVEIADCEYSVSALVQSFRPDFVVIDCGLGVQRARDIAMHLADDPRIQLVRIILAAAPEEYPEECDKKVFARIERPFSIREIADCVNGIRESRAS